MLPTVGGATGCPSRQLFRSSRRNRRSSTVLQPAVAPKICYLIVTYPANIPGLAEHSPQAAAPLAPVAHRSVVSPRFAARLSGLASGLALAVRPAGSVEVSGAQGWVPKIVSAKRLETIFGCP